MKRPRQTIGQLKEQIVVLNAVLGVLVDQAGGYVAVARNDIARRDGTPIKVIVGPEGVEVVVDKPRIIVSV